MNSDSPPGKIKPFLRWPGGKAWLKNNLKEFIPKNINKYYEPFLGGGYVFFQIKPQTAILNDLNNQLILTYKEVKRNVQQIINTLHRFRNDESNYYKIRDQVSRKHSEIAAQFIYLNQTCFNGIYRVNKEGKFNVPFGFRKVDFVNSENLKLCNSALQCAQLISGDFMNSLIDFEKGDFIFLDPPYTVFHYNNGFLEYNKKLFSWEDQERLAELVVNLERKRINFVLTNANHESITKLYSKIGKQFVVERFSTVSSHMTARKGISELIISNCV